MAAHDPRRSRPTGKEERVKILQPYVKELREKRSAMALTIFYGDLEVKCLEPILCPNHSWFDVFKDCSLQTCYSAVVYLKS